MAEPKHSKWTIAALGSGLLLLLLVLAALNAFNLPVLHARGTGQIFLFSGLSVVVFLLLLVLLVLLFRNILKLYAGERSRALGSRIRSRMLVGALLLSIAPAFFMFLFSFLLMNRSIERWFSQPVSQLRTGSTRVAFELTQYAVANARAEAESLASSPGVGRAYDARNTAALEQALNSHRITLEGGFAAIYRDGQPVAAYQLPRDVQRVAILPWADETWTGQADQIPPANQSLATTLLEASRRTDGPLLLAGQTEYVLGAATTSGGGVVAVGLPLPPGLSATIREIRAGAHDYWIMFRTRNKIRRTYLLLLIMITVLTFFASSWLALFLSKQITRPVEALAGAMDEIARGHYGHRVPEASTGEMGDLVHSFNRMAADLEESRALAETSQTQLSQANRALDARRMELETVLETIPSGVITFDQHMRVLQANRAFRRLLGLEDAAPLTGSQLENIFPQEIAGELILLIRRSSRMGVAASEMELPGPRGLLNLTVTSARLELGGDRQGCILVFEDVTEFLRAQRQVAWKEVAQRVAHEIKNPLTPIALSAGRIRRHVDRASADSPGVIRKCSDVILGSVETMRLLVDQFAALAQFPTAQPRPCDLNAIAENALALFAGRLEHLRIDLRLAPGLPPVMADPEGMKRALANLIDNAAEAMQDSLLRELTIETGLAAGHGMAEIAVSDTGHGVDNAMRERLFLPYFSTKQRGTGLGLAIAAKIVQEHGGTIRAVPNTPAGARFLIELPLAEVKHPAEPAFATGNGASA